MFSRISNHLFQSKKSKFSRRYSTIFSRSSNILIACIMLIAFGGALQATADTEANKAIVLRGVELWNTGNLAIADEIFYSDFVNHDPSRPDVTALKSYKGYVVELRAAWPNVRAFVFGHVAQVREIG